MAKTGGTDSGGATVQSSPASEGGSDRQETTQPNNNAESRLGSELAPRRQEKAAKLAEAARRYLELAIERAAASGGLQQALDFPPRPGIVGTRLVEVAGALTAFELEGLIEDRTETFQIGHNAG